MNFFQKLSARFVRLGLAVGTGCFMGGFGFVISALLSTLVAGFLFGLLTGRGFIEVMDSAYAAQPWGWAARLVSAGEMLGLLVSLWMTWQFSGKLFRALSDTQRLFFPLSLAVFLLLESLYLVFSLPRQMRLAIRGRVTTGESFDLHSEDHRLNFYTYTIDGVRYRVGGQPGGVVDSRLGTPIEVYYNPDHPAECCLEEPGRELLHGLLWTPFAINWLCVGPYIAMGVNTLMNRLPRRRGEKPPTA